MSDTYGTDASETLIQALRELGQRPSVEAVKRLATLVQAAWDANELIVSDYDFLRRQLCDLLVKSTGPSEEQLREALIFASQHTPHQPMCAQVPGKQKCQPNCPNGVIARALGMTVAELEMEDPPEPWASIARERDQLKEELRLLKREKAGVPQAWVDIESIRRGLAHGLTSGSMFDWFAAWMLTAKTWEEVLAAYQALPDERLMNSYCLADLGKLAGDIRIVMRAGEWPAEGFQG
jgi:hypothetical protein